jgi:hypothetical protein
VSITFTKLMAQSVSDAIAVSKQVESQLKSDRDFWEEMVRMQIDFDTTRQGVERICQIADALVVARRERYPVKD